MGAMDVENEDCSRRASELPLCRVRHSWVCAGFQHPGVAMRSRYDTGGAVLAREVDQRADRVTGIPDAGHALTSPVCMQSLLAMAWPQPACPHSSETVLVTEDVPGCSENTRLQPRCVEYLLLEQSADNEGARVVLLSDREQILQPRPHGLAAP